MKKIIDFVLCVVTVAFLYGCVTVYANEESDEIRVYLDGERLEFDVPPMIINDRTMVPMRAIFEALGAPVHWDEYRRTIHTTNHVYSITFQIENPRVSLWTHNLNTRANIIVSSYGRTIFLDVPPQIVGNRTLVPLRAVSEIFLKTVEWDADIRTVHILTLHDENINIPNVIIRR